MNQYRTAKRALVFIYSILSLMTLGGAVFIVLFAITGKPERLPGLLFVVSWTATLLWVWYAYLRIPIEITLDESARVQFRSPIRRQTLHAADILSIEARMFSPGFVKVKHRGGTIHLMNQMDGFHELLGTLKLRNPAIVIRGC